MKKQHIIALFISLVFISTGFAQTDAQRTVRTKIADVLALMPAQNIDTYNSLMADLASTGEEGVFLLTRMMNENLSDNNSIIEYAINGLSYYIMGLKDEERRKECALAYTRAIPQVSNMQIRIFFIQQLQIVGKDESVSALRNMLLNESTCTPAAQALAAIKSDLSGQALLNVLASSQGRCQLSIVQAIGDAGFTAAEKDILKIATSTGNAELKSTALTTLSKIGGKASLKTLDKEAAKSGYLFNKTGATEDYIRLMERMLNTPDEKAAIKDALSLYKKCADSPALKSTKIAALGVITKIPGVDKALVMQAIKFDTDPAVRQAALNFTKSFADSSVYNQLINELSNANEAIQIDIINYLAEQQVPEAVDPLIEYLGNDVTGSAGTQAAITALGMLGGEAAMNRLAVFFTSTDKDQIAATKQAMLTTKSDIKPALETVRFNASVPGTVAVIDIASVRHIDTFNDTIFKLANVSAPEIKTAAINALQHISTLKDTLTLFQFLENAGQADIPALQAAIVTALKTLPENEQARVVLSHSNQLASDKQMLYYLVLAKIGDTKGLEEVYKAFASQNGAVKEAAFIALTQWNGFAATAYVLDICKKNASPEYFDKAFDSYVTQANASGYPAAEKVLLLRQALEIAKTTEQKRAVIKSLENNKTFLSLIVTGKYLDDPELANDAAWAVSNIALSNSGFYGPEVLALLNKAYTLLSGPDSEYTKTALAKHINELPKTGGFVSLFNGKDLTGWKGLVGNPLTRKNMSVEKLKSEQAKSDELMRKSWSAKDGLLVFGGTGDNICTEKQYGDFEMYVDWLLYPDSKEADAGIYLRGSPQVQIWDTSRRDVGAQVGSGGLYNNKINPNPLKVADNKLGEWNSFYIKMVGDRVTVYLNGELVVDNVILENYWDRNSPIFPTEQIELQAHGSKVAYRDIYIREIPRREPYRLPADEAAANFKVLFDGTNMHEWIGNTQDYVMEDGCIVIRPERGGSGGNLYTKKEYKNFNFRFEFMLTPGANNGVGIRTPLEGDAAYVGMEIQILDDGAPMYRNLEQYQYHGSVYGVIPAKRGYLKPNGEWNEEEIIVNGNHIIVILNGTKIVDGDIAEASRNGTIDKRNHPGLKNEKGHIGFLGHGSVVRFKNIRIKEL